MFQDPIEFGTTMMQFLQVAAAVRIVHKSGIFDPTQLAAAVEEYCTKYAHSVQNHMG